VVWLEDYWEALCFIRALTMDFTRQFIHAARRRDIRFITIKLNNEKGSKPSWLTPHFLKDNPAPAPSPSSRFGPPNEVKERLHRSALQRLSGLTKALTLFDLN
jgi:hypothetical protein